MSIERFKRKHYLIIIFNPIWLPNHVTEQLFLLKKIVHPWLEEHLCEVSLQFVQSLWRRRFFIDFGVNPIWLPNEVTYDIVCEPFVPHG